MAAEPTLMAVEIHTDDVEKVAAFYRDVIGVDLGPGDDDATHYETAWGDWGSPGFFFFAIQPLVEGVAPTTGAEIGFQVDDLTAAHNRAVAGATVVEPPTARPWGTAATYADPAGNLVQLTAK